MDQTDKLRLAAVLADHRAAHSKGRNRSRPVRGPRDVIHPKRAPSGARIYRTRHRDRTHQSRVAPFTTRLGDQRMAQLGRRRRWAGRAPSRVRPAGFPHLLAEQEQAAVHGLLLLVVQPGSHGGPSLVPASLAEQQRRRYQADAVAASATRGRACAWSPKRCRDASRRKEECDPWSSGSGNSGRVIDAHQSAERRYALNEECGFIVGCRSAVRVHRRRITSTHMFLTAQSLLLLSVSLVSRPVES